MKKVDQKTAKKKNAPLQKPVLKTGGESDDFFEKTRPLYWYLALVGLILVVYTQTISFGYTGFDDEDLVKDNSAVFKDLSNIPGFFVQDVFLGKQRALFYRPVQVISYMLDTVVGGPNPSSYHASNVLIHCFATCLLFYLFLFLHYSKLPSFFFAALFALHPVFVQSVAWIPSRGDLLIGLFGVLTFIFYMKFNESGRIIHLLLHALFFMCSVFSKETAVVLPFLLAFYSFLTKKETVTYNRIVISGVLCFLVLVLWYFLRTIALQGNTALSNVGIAPLLANLPAIPVFISKFFLPVGLSPMPLFTVASILGGAVVIVALVAWALYSKRIRNPLVLFGALWFLLFLLPTLWYRHILGAAAYDYLTHRLYLPAVGLIIVVLALGADQLFRQSKIAVPAIVALLFACGVDSAVLAGNYSEYGTFYNYAIKTNPQSALAYCNRGTSFRLLGHYDKAMPDFDTAIRMAPRYPEPYHGRGAVYLKLGEMVLAEREFSKALELKPDFYEALVGRSIARYMTGNPSAALTDISYAIRLQPNSASAYANRGTIYHQLRKITEAEADYNSAIRLQPNFAQAYIGLGGIRAEAGNNDEALNYFNKAIDADPTSPDGYGARGIFKKSLKDYREAIADMNEAIRIAPRSLELYVNRSVVYEAMGDYGNALRDLTNVIRSSPQNAYAYGNRAVIQYKAGDKKGACDDWNQAVKLGSPNAASFVRQFCN